MKNDLPLVIFCHWRATGEAIAAQLGLKLFLYRDIEAMLTELEEGRSVVVMAQGYAAGWRAPCNPVVLAEVPDGPMRIQAHARGTDR